MKRKLFVIPVFIAFLGVGYLAYALNSSSSAPPQRNVVAAPPSSDLYSCKAPAINTYKFCDFLPYRDERFRLSDTEADPVKWSLRPE